MVDATVSDASSETEYVPSGLEVSHHVSLDGIELDFEGPQVSLSVKSMDTRIEPDKDNNEAGSTHCEEGPEVSIIDPVSLLVGEEAGSSPLSPIWLPPSNAVAQVRTRIGRMVNSVNRLIQTIKQKNTDKKSSHYMHRKGSFGSFAGFSVL